MSELERLGWSADFAAGLERLDPSGELIPARVSEEHRGQYRLLARGGALRATISGRLEYTAASSADLPAVGDWVAAAARPSEGAATIHYVLPRRTALVRSTPDRPTRAQVLAANLDTVFLVTSANRSFSRRRIERTLALIFESGAAPVVVLSKRDLCDDVEALVREARSAAPGVAVHALSGLSGAGVDSLSPYLQPGATIALIGSSGVGKSTLANQLLGSELLATQQIRAEDDRGRHTTTHRQLVPLPAHGVLIDTPGLREIGLWDDEGGLESAFPEFEQIAGECRFPDCHHGNEPGCAVRDALQDGRLDPERIASYEKLQRELLHVRTRRDARARHERRKQSKKFARAIRRRKKDLGR